MKFTSDTVIGIEVHVQLNTKTKLFCSCPCFGTEEPNSRCCPVCLGHPGSKPVINKKAFEYALKLGLATKSTIAKQLIFSRKSYFYPDLAKNYQITQYEIPLATKGQIALSSGKKIHLTRIHLEEDPASLVHQGSIAESTFTLIDYNRSGIPLVEIVTEPELESPEEARDFLKKLRTILLYLEIFDPNKCVIKADANISIKESGYKRVEIKNITGFKDIETALFYEVERQKKNPQAIIMETRGYDAAIGKTYTLRKKESEEDYGYITDPDLVPIDITKAMLDAVKKEIPELAEEKAAKFVKKHKIKKEDAEILAAEKEIAQLFEEVAEKVHPELAAKWIRRELTRVLNFNQKTLKDVELEAKHLIDLLKLVHSKKITEKTGQRLIEKLVEKPFDVLDHVMKEGLEAVSETFELEKYCKEAILENPGAVADYKEGNEKALNYIVGSVMKKTKGKATPREVNEILRRILK